MNTFLLRLTVLGLAVVSAGWLVLGPRLGSTGESTRTSPNANPTTGHQTARRIETGWWTAPATSSILPELAVVEIPVTSGVAECLINGHSPADYEVVVGSLAPGDRMSAVHLAWETLEASNPAESIRGDREIPAGSGQPGMLWRHFGHPTKDPFPGRIAATPGSGNAADHRGEVSLGGDRSFHFPVWRGVASGGGAWEGKQIAARLLATHATVRVYVDRQDVDHRVSPQTAQMIAMRLADVALPVVESWLGPITDVDGDGCLSVLMTSEVEHLPQGGEPLRAFVRSADLEAGPRSGSERPTGPVDLIYLNAHRWQDGGLDGVLTHEATHLAVFSRRREAGLPLRAEEWIDEGLAHAVEWLGVGDASNLEARWAAFRAAPQRAALEVNCRAGSTAWRQAESRGATARFFTHLVQRYGVSTLPGIALATNSGRSAVAEGTGIAFDKLFRDWTVSEAISRHEQDQEDGPRSPSHGRQTWTLRGTAAVSIRLGLLPAGTGCRLRLEGPEGVPLQLTLVRRGLPTMSDGQSSPPKPSAASTLLDR